jgi:DNA processing protein
MVAIVGSRNASVGGRKIAATIARDLGTGGFVVASGLARGIDAAAQEAALGTGTVAAFAGGIDHVYPPEHAPLAQRIIAEGGGHISEMPFGFAPRAKEFPRRNRIVSGLSLGVVIIEAADRSGTLITARDAGEQGRIVFAIPGSPLDPRAAGTNRLLKDGAILTTSADDVLSVLEPMLGRPSPPPHLRAPIVAAAPAAVDRGRDLVIEALALDRDRPTIRLTGLRPGEFARLIELDLAGRSAILASACGWCEDLPPRDVASGWQ